MSDYIEPKALVATLETAIANGKTEWQEVDDFVLSQAMDMYEFENDNAVYDHAYGTFDLMFDLVGDTDAIASSTTFVKVEQDIGLPIDEETKVSDCDSRSMGPVKVEQNMRERVHSAESDIDGSSGGRFAPPTSDQDFTDILKETESKHTRKNTMWSLRILTEWCRTNDIKPDISSMSAEQINFNMSRFVLEVRRQDGEPYPPRSLYIIMCGILRHLRESGVSFNFFDEKYVRFHQLQRTLDARMKQLTKEGKGCQKKQAEPITPAKE